MNLNIQRWKRSSRRGQERLERSGEVPGGEAAQELRGKSLCIPYIDLQGGTTQSGKKN